MTVLVRRIRSAILPVQLDDSWPRLVVYGLFWVSTALLATVLLVADPVFGSFVVGIPLFVVVLVRERGLDGISPVLLGAAIGTSLVFSMFLGQYRGVFGDGLLIAGFAVFVVWVTIYPIMVRQMNRQHDREQATSPDEVPHHPAARLYVVRVWMMLLACAVVVAANAHDLLGT
jgi:hypothetical protein